MYKVLYRAYRPETFEEVLGQEHIIKILKNQIEADKVHHAYLFCGTRGTGKTTTARLLAKGVNCLSEETKPCGKCKACVDIQEGNFLDIVEIDAASNNGIDNIRELRESIKYPPAIGKRKVYIIDEVHMLSTGAFNAFLKTLEEPPAYVTFVLATTEPHKLPATILSRCMRLDFRRVPETKLIDSMRNIAAEQGVEMAEDALKLIGINADGSARDGLTLLDQCISSGSKTVSREDVLEALGTVDEEAFIRLTEAVLSQNPSQGIIVIDDILSQGKDPRQIMNGWLSHYRNLLMVKFVRKPEDVINMSLENIERIRDQAQEIDLEDVSKGINVLADNINMARWSTQPRILLELALVKLSSLEGGRTHTPPRAELNTDGGRTSVKEAPLPKPEETTSIKEAPLPKPEETTSIKEAPLPKPEETTPIKEAPLPKPEETTPIIEPDAGVPCAQGAAKTPLVQGVEKANQPPQSVGEATQRIDLERVWGQVVDEGITIQASFSMLDFGAKLVDINQREFSVEAGVGAQAYIEKYRELIESLFLKYSGIKRRLVLVEQNKKTEKEKPQASLAPKIEETVKQAEAFLGIKVETEN